MEKFPSWHFCPLPAFFFSQRKHVTILYYNFPLFLIEISLAISLPGMDGSCGLFVISNIIHFAFLLDLYLLFSHCLFASISRCPNPEFLFFYFLVNSMFNVILMSKCVYFNANCIYLSFLEKRCLTVTTNFKSHGNVTKFYQSAN